MKSTIRVVTRYGSGIKGLKRAGIRDHSPGIWNHNACYGDQHCFSWNQESEIHHLFYLNDFDIDDIQYLTRVEIVFQHEHYAPLSRTTIPPALADKGFYKKGDYLLWNSCCVASKNFSDNITQPMTVQLRK